MFFMGNEKLCKEVKVGMQYLKPVSKKIEINDFF